ncbi:MAG TPA: hypothetical protein VF523_00260 [Burkholderiales bacterium]
MLTILLIGQILSWIVIVALAAAGLALARQVGILHERVAPMGALMSGQGPKPSDIAPARELPSSTGAVVSIGGPAVRRRLLLFVGPDCPICKKIIPLARRVANAEKLDLQLATDADEQDVRKMIEAGQLHDLPIVNSRELGLAYAVDKLPHAVLISTEGMVLARGLVNSREHLESLVVADEMGLGSVQDFLGMRNVPAERENSLKGGEAA